MTLSAVGYQVFADVMVNGKCVTYDPPLQQQWYNGEDPEYTYRQHIWGQSDSSSVFRVVRLDPDGALIVFYVGYNHNTPDDGVFSTAQECGEFVDLDAAIVAAQMMVMPV